MKIVLLGMNHRTAPVDVRERFATDRPGPLLRKLVDRPEIDEAALISTCNRVEIVVTAENADAAEHVLFDFFARDLAQGQGPSAGALEALTYVRRGRQAVEHVFRVASAIDSMVVGEPQILGQMKDAYREAAEAGVCGAVLSRLFQRAFATAKRVKNETRIAERPVSVARVAVDLARQIFERLEDKRALLIGAGEMIEPRSWRCAEQGLETARVANRTPARAEALARRFGGTAHGLDELDALLPTADVVLTCVGGDGRSSPTSACEAALRASQPADLPDRHRRAAQHRPARQRARQRLSLRPRRSPGGRGRQRGAAQRESERGEMHRREEQEHFDGWLAALQAVPTIRHLRARAEAIRNGEIERLRGRLDSTSGSAKASSISRAPS